MTTTTIPPFQEAGQKIIPIGAGVSFQWLHDGKIIAFTAEMSRDRQLMPGQTR